MAGLWCGSSGSGAARNRDAPSAECARRVGQDATDIARVAAELAVGCGTVMRAVAEYGQRILDARWLSRLSMLGLDETAFLAATAVSPSRFVTGLVNLAPAGGGFARLLDVVEGRSGQAVTAAKERAADLVVVGALRDTGIADRLLGTVATEVVRRTGREVLVVRPPPRGGRTPPAARPRTDLTSTTSW